MVRGQGIQSGRFIIDSCFYWWSRGIWLSLFEPPPHSRTVRTIIHFTAFTCRRAEAAIDHTSLQKNPHVKSQARDTIQNTERCNQPLLEKWCLRDCNYQFFITMWFDEATSSMLSSVPTHTGILVLILILHLSHICRSCQTKLLIQLDNKGAAVCNHHDRPRAFLPNATSH